MTASKIPRAPLIVILGPTGTGKSKLAVSLASKCNGEIINGDAVQMYQGLPIVTNKIPEKERNGIPHHLLDFIELNQKPWTVHEFVKESSKTIDEIRARGKLPILVGGTHYYVHGLLFRDSMLEEEFRQAEEEMAAAEQNGLQGSKFDILNESTEEIFARLQQVDPVMASRWHPNDRRKIRRSLEIWLQTGRKPSEIYAEQQQQKRQTLAYNENDSDGHTGEGLRFDALIYWLDAEDAVLKKRLNDRVDTMVESGLLDEVEEMHIFVRQSQVWGRLVDQRVGIWMAIGYKELEPWLTARTDANLNETVLNRLRDACIEAVKAGTRRYAKRQNRYIRLRLANALREVQAERSLFLLDSTNLEQWHDSVEVNSRRLLNDFLAGRALPEPSSLSRLAAQTFEQMGQMLNYTKDPRSHFCNSCQKTLMTETEWQNHLRSRSHKKTLASQRKHAGISQTEIGHELQENKEPPG